MIKNQKLENYRKNFIPFTIVFAIGIILVLLSIYSFFYPNIKSIAFNLAIAYFLILLGIFIYKYYVAFATSSNFFIGIILIIGSPLVILGLDGISSGKIIITIIFMVIGFENIFPTLLLKYRIKKNSQK